MSLPIHFSELLQVKLPPLSCSSNQTDTNPMNKRRHYLHWPPVSAMLSSPVPFQVPSKSPANSLSDCSNAFPPKLSWAMEAGRRASPNLLCLGVDNQKEAAPPIRIGSSYYYYLLLLRALLVLVATDLPTRSQLHVHSSTRLWREDVCNQAAPVVPEGFDGIVS